MPFKIVAKLTEALGRSAQPSERLPQILGGDARGIAMVVIDAAVVAELSLAIEHENLWREPGAEGANEGL